MLFPTTGSRAEQKLARLDAAVTSRVDFIWCNLVKIVEVKSESVVYAAVEVLIQVERPFTEAAVFGVERSYLENVAICAFLGL